MLPGLTTSKRNEQMVFTSSNETTAAGTKMTSLAFSLGGMDRPALCECRGADAMQFVDVKPYDFQTFQASLFHSFRESVDFCFLFINQPWHGFFFSNAVAGPMEFPTFPLRMTMSFSQKHLKRTFIKAWRVQLSKESSMVAWLAF